jgi:CheY-like chemotaxis protein/HPt (histidine-containing phosphotransfer) domain-containing protein
MELIGNPPTGVEVVRRHGRLGLDVQLCRRMAELMGGRLSIHGSTPSSHVLRLVLALPFAAPCLEGGCLLIIENNDDDRQALVALFSCHGMEVHAFASVGPALEVLRSKAGTLRAAIIGCDEQGFDAEFLAAAIKADPHASGLRLAALCDASDGMPAGLAQAGFDAVIGRPLDEASALAAIMSLCGGEEPDVALVPSPASRQDFSGRRILVADDNSVNLQVARRMLEKHGCRVDVAADGAQALAMHKATPYELILMDCQMPGMDGREAATRIRALEGDASRVPVVAVTACATPSERECCLAAGMDDFIAKPLRPQVLDAALTRWLRELPAIAAKTPVVESACKDELDAVKEMFGADFAELARLYHNDSPPRIAALHDAAAAGDSAAVAKVAHAFSGSSASIGASGLAALCKQLELHAKTGSLDGFSERMHAIENEYERICRRMEFLLAQEASWRKN